MFQTDAKGGLKIDLVMPSGETVRLTLRPRTGRDNRKQRHGLRLGIDAPPGVAIKVLAEGDLEVEEPTPMAHELARRPDGGRVTRAPIYGHIGKEAKRG